MPSTKRLVKETRYGNGSFDGTVVNKDFQQTADRHPRERGLRFGDFAYRERFIKGYVIVYRIAEEEVLLLRFFHQAQMYERFVMEWER